MSLTYEPAAVSLRAAGDDAVRDAEGHAVAATGGGYGLSGIKERGKLLGGTQEAATRGEPRPAMPELPSLFRAP